MTAAQAVVSTRQRRAFVDVLRKTSSEPLLAEGAFAELLVQHSPARLQHSTANAEEEAGDEEPTVELPVEVAEGPRGAGLFSYQSELVDEFVSLVQGPREVRVGLVGLPTGSGKTRMAATACLRLFTAHSLQRVLWIAPTSELLEQAISAFKLLVSLGEGPRQVELVRLVLGGKASKEGPAVLFATCQLLARRWGSLKTRAIEPVELVIFDEAHYALAPTYLDAVEGLVRASRNGAGLIGLTATPGRRDEQASERLVEVFGRRWLVSAELGNRPLDTLREMGILSTLHFRRIEFMGSGPGTRLSRAHLKTQSSANLAVNPERFRAVLATISQFPVGERAIVFAASIEHGAAITAALRSKNISARLVSGYQDAKARRHALEAFEGGDATVLVNKAVLIAGYDCPAVKHIVLTVPVRSAITFEQMVGRGCRGRRVGGNNESFVWELDDMLALHGSPSSYSRYRDQSWTRGKDD